MLQPIPSPAKWLFIRSATRSDTDPSAASAKTEGPDPAMFMARAPPESTLLLQRVVPGNESLAVRLRHDVVHRTADQRHVAQQPGHKPADVAPLRDGMRHRNLAGQHLTRLPGADHNAGMRHGVEKVVGHGQPHDVERPVAADQHHAAQHRRTYIVGMGRAAQQRFAHHGELHQLLAPQNGRPSSSLTP